MKMKRIIVLALALLLIGCIAGFTVSAEDAVPKATIGMANVAYNDMMHVVFTVENVPAGAVAGIVMWDNTATEYTMATKIYEDFTPQTDGGMTYYTTKGVAAKDIGTVYYFAACYKLDGVTVIGDVRSYSVAKYAASRLDDDNVSAAQAELYNNILLYGLASDGVLGGDTYAVIYANVGEEITTVVSFGESVTLTAAAENFAGWQDADGNVVSESAEFVIPAEDIQLGLAVSYTAIYN